MTDELTRGAERTIPWPHRPLAERRPHHVSATGLIAVGLATAMLVAGPTAAPAEERTATVAQPPVAEVRPLYPHTLPPLEPRDIAYLGRETLLAVDGQMVFAVGADIPGHGAWPGPPTAGWTPVRIDTDPRRGRVYVLDGATERIEAFDTDGRSLRTLTPRLEPPASGRAQVESMTVAPNGDVLALELDIDATGAPIAAAVHRFGADGAPADRWAIPVPAVPPHPGDARGSIGRIAVSGDGVVLVQLAGGAACADWRTTVERYAPDGTSLGAWSAEVPTALLPARPLPICPTPTLSDMVPMARDASDVLYVFEHDSVLRYGPDLRLINWVQFPWSRWRQRADLGALTSPVARTDGGIPFAVRPGGGFAVVRQVTHGEVDSYGIGADNLWSRRGLQGNTLLALVEIDAIGNTVAFAPGGSSQSSAGDGIESVWTDRLSVLPDGRAFTLAVHYGIVTRWARDGSREGAWYTPGGAWDIDALADGGWVLLGQDSDGIAVSRYDDAGHRLWRAVLDIHPARGLVTTGDEVLLADRHGRAIRRWTLAAGVPLPDVRSPSQNMLWPFGLARARSDSTTLSVLDLPGMTVERWTFSLPGDGAQPNAPAEVWPISRRLVPIELAAAGDGRVAVLGDDGMVEFVGPGGAVTGAWRPDGGDGPTVPVDLAFGTDGRLIVLDGYVSFGRALHSRRRPRLLIYDSAAAPPPAVETPSTPPPSPSPGAGACVVRGTIALNPTRVRAGEAVTVTEWVGGACPEAVIAPVDVILAFVQTGRDAIEREMPAMTAAAGVFVDALDWRRASVGIVARSDAQQCTLRQPLLADRGRTLGTLSALRPQAACTTQGWVRLIRDELALGARGNAVRVLVVFTAGARSDTATDGVISDLEPIARIAAAGGEIHVLEIGGPQDSIARRYASRPEHHHVAPDEASLRVMAAALGTRIRGYALGDVLLESEVHPDVDLVPGSAAPPVGAFGRRLQYGLPIAPSDGITLTYRVVPRVGGRYPANARSVARYTDGDGARRALLLDQPYLDVEGPTRTPSPAPTATATAGLTPTSIPHRTYLPVALHEECPAERLAMDVAFVLDASHSMTTPTATGRSRLAAAIQAIHTFMTVLAQRPGTRFALVPFDATAHRAASLTENLATVRSALDGVTPGAGSCLACGLTAAHTLWHGEAERGDRRRSVIIVTDADLDAAATAAAVEAGQALRSAGTAVFAVGVGEDVPAKALAAITGDPGSAFATSDAEALDAVLEGIRRAMRCPPASLWPSRWRPVAADKAVRTAILAERDGTTADFGPEERQCRLKLQRFVEPAIVRLETPLVVKMTVVADCRSAVRPVSLVFVMDRSSWADATGPMVSDAVRIGAMADGIARYAGQSIDLSSSRIGVIAYDERPQVVSGLTVDILGLADKLRRVGTGAQVRDPASALDRARTMLAGQPAERVVVLFGGNVPIDPGALRDAASRLQRAGVTLLVLEVRSGETDATYRNLVPAERYRISEPDDPAATIPWLAADPLGLALRSVEVHDTLLPTVRFDGSTSGPHRLKDEGAPHLWWDILDDQPNPGPSGIGLVDTYVQYEVRTTALGPTKVGDPVYAEITYRGGATRRVPFDAVEVDVIPPRPTDPATPSPLPATEWPTETAVHPVPSPDRPSATPSGGGTGTAVAPVGRVCLPWLGAGGG
ncbi:MAG: VWA domain-containing protein [Ardenticatenales bacterium]|nr:VWA domain-containing protein [Ardenticatenales bacterium]